MAIEMDVDLEAIAKKVDILEDKVSKLEKVKMPYIVETDTQRLKEAVHKYLEYSREIGNLWKGKLSSVEEIRTMRRHVKG